MKLYLDTNIIRDCLKRRNLDTIQLLEIIRERKLECFTSIFTVMELLDNEKDDLFFNEKLKKGFEISKILRQRSNRNIKIEDLKDIGENINNLFASYQFIQFTDLTGEGWRNAFIVCQRSNLDSDDSIHLATAIGSGSDILLTSDGFLKKEGLNFVKTISEELGETVKLEILNPKEMLNRLHKKSEEPIDSTLNSEDKIGSATEPQ